MSESSKYDHLVHIRDHSELGLYELVPNVVWIFDLDKHGWWWGNSAAVSFWNLNNLQELIDKDLFGDTQGTRDRTLQTFELAAKDGLAVDPWTTYSNGKPKTLLKYKKKYKKDTHQYFQPLSTPQPLNRSAKGPGWNCLWWFYGCPK